ncbi:hypothetical protein ACU8KH_00096 [Lachancea thermotolerans]
MLGSRGRDLQASGPRILVPLLRLIARRELACNDRQVSADSFLKRQYHQAFGHVDTFQPHLGAYMT